VVVGAEQVLIQVLVAAREAALGLLLAEVQAVLVVG
jgi:hypothetical protein